MFYRLKTIRIRLRCHKGRIEFKNIRTPTLPVFIVINLTGPAYVHIHIDLLIYTIVIVPITVNQVLSFHILVPDQLWVFTQSLRIFIIVHLHLHRIHILK